MFPRKSTTYETTRQNIRKKENLSGSKQFLIDICTKILIGYIFFCINTFRFMQTQFKGSSREIEQQGRRHETRTLNKLNNVNARLKKSIVIVFLKLLLTSFPLIQNK